MILIASDFHLGYDHSTEREKDPYFALDEILGTEGIDMIIFAGDLFDSRVPRLEVFSEAMQFLSKLKCKNNGGQVKLIESDKPLSPRAIEGIPFISVYGNHERRAELVNPVQALDRASLLVNLHCQKIVFEVNSRKIAIQGMSYVPEKYARGVLSAWNPKPVEGAINILLMHQNIEPFVYSDLEDVYLKISDLPQGFDYVVDGHIHWHNEVKIGEGRLLMPGSTIPTDRKSTRLNSSHRMIV
jgi:DNA repair exonuclease SbcCD nuclease subunit